MQFRTNKLNLLYFSISVWLYSLYCTRSDGTQFANYRIFDITSVVFTLKKKKGFTRILKVVDGEYEAITDYFLFLAA